MLLPKVSSAPARALGVQMVAIEIMSETSLFPQRVNSASSLWTTRRS